MLGQIKRAASRSGWRHHQPSYHRSLLVRGVPESRSQSVERQRASLVNNAVEVGVLERVSASRWMLKDTPRGQLGHPQAHSAQRGVRGPDQHPRIGFEAILPVNDIQRCTNAPTFSGWS